MHTEKHRKHSLSCDLFPLNTDNKSQNLTNESIDHDEEEREEDEACVPHPDCLVNGRDAEEDKDHGFWSVGEDLHGVSDCADGLLVHVCVDVLLAAHTTEDDPTEQKHIKQISEVKNI